MLNVTPEWCTPLGGQQSNAASAAYMGGPVDRPVFLLTHHTRPPIEMEGGTTARRVFPIPAVPVNVTIRAVRRRRLISASSCSRPTKLVTGSGKCPTCKLMARSGT